MRAVLIATVAALAAGTAAHAQGMEDRLRSQLTSTVAELRSVKAAQADIVAQKAAAERERDALKAELAAARAKLAAAPRRGEPSDADLTRARAEQKAVDQTRIDAADAEARRLGQEAAQLHAEGDRRTAELAASGETLALCRTKHAELTALTHDMLGAYDRLSGADMLLRREPVTGLKRVQLQTLVQGFGDRLYAAGLNVKPRAPPATAAQSQTQ